MKSSSSGGVLAGKKANLTDTGRPMDTDDPFDEPVELPLTDEIDLHGFSPRDMKEVAVEYLRAAAEHGFREVRIVHGKGIGTQRRIIQSMLASNPYVESFRDAPADMGGLGATVVVLKATKET